MTDQARILLVTREYPPVRGGIGTYCWELAHAAVMRGHAVDVVAPLRGHRPRADSQLDDGAGAGPTVHRFRGHSSPLRDVLPIWWAMQARLLAREPYDVVHAADRASLIAAVATHLRGARLCTTVYGSDITRWRTSQAFRLLDPWLYRVPRRVAAISEFTRGEYDALVGSRTASATCTVPLAVSAWWWQARDSEPRFERGDGQIVIGTVGRLEPRKGQFEVVAACDQLPESVRRRLVYLVIGFGDRGYARRLQQAAQAAGVQLVWIADARREELPGLYRQMDVHILFAQPVRHTVEGFGLVLLEAATQGVPSITTRVGGIPEVVEDGVTGLVLPHDDLGALATALEHLPEQRDHYRELGQNARMLAQRRSWSDVARETYNFFLQ